MLHPILSACPLFCLRGGARRRRLGGVAWVGGEEEEKETEASLSCLGCV